MPTWLLFSMLAALSWGAWGVVSKVAADAVPPLQNQVLSTLGLLAPVAFLLARQRGALAPAATQQRGWWLAFASGLTGGLGNLALLTALTGGGQAAVVFPLTATYPLLTVLGAWLWLRERLHWVQVGGIGAALAALVLFNVAEGGSREWRDLTASRWMFMALLATVLYGATGLLQKVATGRVSAEASLVAFAAAFIPMAAIIVLWPRLEWRFAARDWLWATLGGALNGLGVLATLAAYRQGGKASLVTPLAALYPVVTALLAVALLGERVAVPQALAIALALAGGVALAWERTTSANDALEPPCGGNR